MEQPESRLETLGDSTDILRIGNQKSHWLGELLCLILMVGFCLFLVDAGYRFMQMDASNPFGIVIVFGGIVGVFGSVVWFIKRLEFLRDRQPKLTLSMHALCDHRTGVNVALAEVDSIRFIYRTHRTQVLEANLHLTMNDAIEHVFDLRFLDLPSEEIAWRVTTNAGIEDAKGVSNPAKEELGPVGYILVGVCLVCVFWKIYQLAMGLPAN